MPKAIRTKARILEQITKYIGTKKCVSFDKYCCNELRRLREFLAKNGHEFGMFSRYKNGKLSVYMDNDAILFTAPKSRFEIEFTLNYCPFCGAEIVYEIVVEDNTK
jgi:hypothetical protein